MSVAISSATGDALATSSTAIATLKTHLARLSMRPRIKLPNAAHTLSDEIATTREIYAIQARLTYGASVSV